MSGLTLLPPDICRHIASELESTEDVFHLSMACKDTQSTLCVRTFVYQWLSRRQDLERAVQWGYADIVEPLLRRHLDKNEIDREHFSNLLRRAATRGHTDTLRLLIAHQPASFLCPWLFPTPWEFNDPVLYHYLLLVCDTFLAGHSEAADVLLCMLSSTYSAYSAYLDTFPRFCQNVLHYFTHACSLRKNRGDANSVANAARVLLKHGAKASSVDRMTMIHLARAGQADLLRQLLRHGAPYDYDAALTAFVNRQWAAVRVYEDRRGPVHTRIMMAVHGISGIISITLSGIIFLCLGTIVLPVLIITLALK